MGYLGELWKLWRGRGDNPLCQYGWRRRWRVVIAAFLHLLAVVSALMIYLQTRETVDPLTLDEAYYFIFLSPIVLHLLVWLTFFFSSSNWRSDNGLIDLKLSMLTVPEIGFGLVYRPVLRSLLFLLYFLAMGSLFAIEANLQLKLNRYGDYYAWILMLPAMILFTFMSITYQVRAWLMEWTNPLRILVRSTLKALILYVLYLVSVRLGIELFQVWRQLLLGVDKWRADTMGLLVASLILIFLTVLLIKYRSVYKLIQHKRVLFSSTILCAMIIAVISLDYFWVRSNWGRWSYTIPRLEWVFYLAYSVIIVAFALFHQYVVLQNLKDRIFFSLNPIPMLRFSPFTPGFKKYAQGQKTHPLNIGKKLILLSVFSTAKWFFLVVLGTIISACLLEYAMSVVFTGHFNFMNAVETISRPSFAIFLSVVLPYIYFTAFYKETRRDLFIKSPCLIFYYSRIHAMIFVGFTLAFHLVFQHRFRPFLFISLAIITFIPCLMVTLMMIDWKVSGRWVRRISLTALIGHFIYSMNFTGWRSRPFRHLDIYMIRGILEYTLVLSLPLMIFIIIPYLYNKIYSQAIRDLEQ